MSISQNPDKIDEEFNNFMHKVTQVSNIVHKLASKDKTLQEIGDIEAREYLGRDDDENMQQIDENNAEIRVKTDKTVINKAALQKEDSNPQSMTQEAFMKEVSRDAEQRYKDKLVRKERMETFKKQATLAFRRSEFEKALSLYTKGIEQIKDSGLLYKNRSLTHIKLQMYDKALLDLEWALKLDEDDLKAWLLSAKVHYLKGDMDNYQKAIDEASKRNPSHEDFIREYVKEIENDIE